MKLFVQSTYADQYILANRYIDINVYIHHAIEGKIRNKNNNKRSNEQSTAKYRKYLV